jgi:HlyD family secretion protein
VARIVPTVDRAKATVMTKIRFEQLDPRILPEMSAKVVFLSQAPPPRPEAGDWRSTRRRWSSATAASVVFALTATRWRPCRDPGRTLGDALEITGGALKPATGWCWRRRTSWRPAPVAVAGK